MGLPLGNPRETIGILLGNPRETLGIPPGDPGKPWEPPSESYGNDGNIPWGS